MVTLAELFEKAGQYQQDFNDVQFGYDVSKLSKAETENLLGTIQVEILKGGDYDTLTEMRSIALDHIGDIEKAVYADTAENRKLGRVGQEYGGKGSRGGKGSYDTSRGGKGYSNLSKYTEDESKSDEPGGSNHRLRSAAEHRKKNGYEMVDSWGEFNSESNKARRMSELHSKYKSHERYKIWSADEREKKWIEENRPEWTKPLSDEEKKEYDELKSQYEKEKEGMKGFYDDYQKKHKAPLRLKTSDEMARDKEYEAYNRADKRYNAKRHSH